MRASRLLSILILLQMRGRLSAEALAAEFEVSVRTIYRDIDQLSAAGVPVYAERGRAGGFALLDGYRTKLTGFTPAEADALVLAGVGGAAAAQLKLLASLPPDAGASAQRVAQRFHLDPANWYTRAEALPLLRNISANGTRLHELTERLVRMEGHADDIHAAGLKRLFKEHGEANPTQFLIARELFRHLERVTDSFEDVANEIDGLVIDHA